MEHGEADKRGVQLKIGNEGKAPREKTLTE